MNMKKLGLNTLTVIGIAFALPSCHKGPANDVSEADVIAKMEAEKEREAEERDRAREKNRQRIMDELREKDLVKQTEQGTVDVVDVPESMAKASPVEESASLPDSATERANVKIARLNARAAAREVVEERDAAINKADDVVLDQKERLGELEDAAEVARFGPKGSKIRLSGADSTKTRFADEAVKKQHLRIAKAEKALEVAEKAAAVARKAYRAL